MTLFPPIIDAGKAETGKADFGAEEGGRARAGNDHVAYAAANEAEFGHIGDDAEIAQRLENAIEQQAALQHERRVGAIGADAVSHVGPRLDAFQEVSSISGGSSQSTSQTI